MTSPAVPSHGLALTVLGSGGPFQVGERVSSRYVVWLDGRARLLVDAAGGTFERLGRVAYDGPITGAHDLQALPVPVTGPPELGDTASG